MVVDILGKSNSSHQDYCIPKRSSDSCSISEELVITYELISLFSLILKTCIISYVLTAFL